ncbi:MAG: tRNA lysidine(34) synthetase TilS [Lacunisphaera sp.]|nr:tRNA lysidine(34) synthetase TilS [Lacunisphaera sp.]
MPPAKLHPAVRRWVETSRSRGPWGVAFSGGADSLALLLLLRAHWPGREIVALHFNHRLRGRESEADEKFCRRVCAGLGIRLRVGRWRGDHRGASEAEAREARHGFFAQEMKRLRSRALWLAHQQDDIAETILMRLARGSGTAGLAAPRPVHLTADGRVHLRPLLTLKKAELLAALRRAGATWREDSTNAREDFFRNRVRRVVLPAWAKAAGRDALAGAALARERLEEDDQALELWLETLAPLGRDRQLDLRMLTGMPRAIMRRALHRWLLAQRQPSDLSRQGFEILLAAVERGGPTRFSLGTRGFAVIRRGRLAFQPV